MIRIKLEDILKTKDKSMYWLAKKTDLTYTAIYKIVNQQTEGIQFHTLEEIMKILNINSFDDILEIIPDEE